MCGMMPIWLRVRGSGIVASELGPPSTARRRGPRIAGVARWSTTSAYVVPEQAQAWIEALLVDKDACLDAMELVKVR